MAYASAVELTVQNISRAGLALDKLAVAPTATHGNKFWNDGKTFLYAKNANAATRTLTIDTPGSVDGCAIADIVITLAATGDGAGADKVLIGPFTTTFNQSDGYVWVVPSAVADVTVAVFRLT